MKLNHEQVPAREREREGERVSDGLTAAQNLSRETLDTEDA
jgi:hypothetical protein